MSARFRPFSNGTEYMDWLDRNCCRCRRYHVSRDGDPVRPFCPMEKALRKACVMDGTITWARAERIGLVTVRRESTAPLHPPLEWQRLARLATPCHEMIYGHTKPPTAWYNPIGAKS